MSVPAQIVGLPRELPTQHGLANVFLGRGLRVARTVGHGMIAVKEGRAVAAGRTVSHDIVVMTEGGAVEARPAEPLVNYREGDRPGPDGGGFRDGSDQNRGSAEVTGAQRRPFLNKNILKYTFNG